MKDEVITLLATLAVCAVMVLLTYVAITREPITLGYHEAPQWMVDEAKLAESSAEGGR